MAPGRKSLATSLLGAAALWCLVLACLHHGAVDGQLVKGEGGSSATYVYTDLFDSYNFVQDQVVLKYRESTGERAQVLADYEAGKLDFVLQDAPLPDQLNPPGDERFIEVPILGNAVSFVHSVYLPPVNGTTPNLNLSRSTLARIFAGAVRTWDDDAIKADNPRLPEGTLPPDNITLVIRSGQPGINAVLLKALSTFDAGFASVLAASNGSLDGLPPSLEGRAKAFPTKGSQFGYFYRNVTKALVYAANEYATLLRLSGYFRRTNVTWLINSAGQALPPNSTTIQWTLREFQPAGRGVPLPRYLIDGQSPTSYPVCFFTTLVLRRNLTGVRECLGTRAYLNYNVWALSNQRSKLTVPSYGISNLLPAYQSRVMNILPTVACDGESALRYSSMSGLGVTAPFMSSWASFYDAATTPLQITYYDETTLSDGSEQMKAGNVDFGTTLVVTPSLVSRQSSSFDLKYLPMAGFALSIGYNVPELVGKPPLVLDLYTVSLFFTGEITQWNDTRIQTLNPSASLPNANISLPLAPNDEAMVMLTQALASVNPDIAQVLAQNSSNSLAALSLSPFSLVIETGLAMYVNQTAYTLAAIPHYIVSSFQDSYEFIAEASLLDRQGNPVAPDTQGVLAAMRESETQINGGLTPSILSTQTNGTYPLAGYAYTLISMSEMTDCTRAKELVQWLWWSISSSSGSQLAAVNNIVLPLESTKRAILSTLVDVTCQGVFVNALRPCVQDGVICSNEGTCANGVCLCNATRTGTYCESVKTDDLSTGAIVGIVVGVVVPVLVLLCLLVLAVLLILLCCRNRREDEEWMIDASEIEFAELLGAGGFGEVRKAVWRGTEVAVKTVASGYITNDIRNAFIDEVRLMTSLRHPNVVLFMGAATKPPKMCIVMEYMSLGSLYDVLHNELLPDIPHQLRIKMMRQAAKGMYFLHSSGIVHRDLKSLNLLLDSKWNVKVSDFGLTKFQDQLKKENQNQLLELGSIHWTAPEVLSEMHGIDLEAADVYSFGIVLWEVISREDVYSGMSPAAVAVAVLRDDLRPEVPEATPESYASLMVNCWDKDPTVRPKFLEIMTRLESFEEKSSTGWGGASTSSTMSGISGWGGGTSDKGSSSTGGSHSSNGSTSSDGKKEAVRGVKPPTGEVTIVFTDVVRAGALWEFNAEAMKDATILHNEVVRGLLAQHKGYEVVSTTREGAGGEGSLFVVFQDAARALEWCMAVQLALLEVQWPAALFAHPAAAEEWGDTDDRLIYRGLRVRMGVHVGQPRKVFNAMSRRAEYMGPAVNTAARITTMSHGGQIVVSQAVYDRIRDSGLAKEKKRLASLGKFDMPDSPQGVTLFELRTRKLEARFFGGTTTGVAAYTSDSNPSGGDGSDHHGKARRRTVIHASGGGGDPDGNGDDDEQEVCSTGSGVLVGGDHVVQMEESFLASANLCRWIIDYGDIKVGRQVGMGSYGLVFHGRWKGIEVAVKRFIKQKLTERRLLEFRAEMAFLSELHHPNVVVFIGACVKMPNLCIVTEFVKQGALKDLLYAGPHGSTMVKLGESTRGGGGGGGGGGQVVVKLEWKQRLRMLRSAALGVNYLHTLEPVIIHRDLKSSNLLVDENWNVKVADFGFARLKEDNATMTRCGTPCWTAPEVIRGERYSEKADVYSFGIIMWEVMARKQPFAGRNFMGVSLDVLEGKRPQVPADCPEEFKKVMTKCWHAKPDKRPTMEEVVAFLDKLIGDGGDLV